MCWGDIGLATVGICHFRGEINVPGTDIIFWGFFASSVSGSEL